MSKNICVDFDGVLNNYEGWNGVEELYSPSNGAKEFLEELYDKYYVIIFTARDVELVEEWLVKYDMPFNEVTNIKRGAFAYIDDRAICFKGDYNDILNTLSVFKAHWE